MICGEDCERIDQVATFIVIVIDTLVLIESVPIVASPSCHLRGVIGTANAGLAAGRAR